MTETTPTPTKTLAEQVGKLKATERAELLARYRALLDKLDQPAQDRDAHELKFVREELLIDDELYVTHVEVRKEALGLVASILADKRAAAAAKQRQIDVSSQPADTVGALRAANKEIESAPDRYPDRAAHQMAMQEDAVHEHGRQVFAARHDFELAFAAAGTAFRNLRRLKAEFPELLSDISLAGLT